MTMNLGLICDHLWHAQTRIKTHGKLKLLEHKCQWFIQEDNLAREGGTREKTGLLMADEDVQVTGEKVGQIQTQQQQTPSTPTVSMCLSCRDVFQRALLPLQWTLSCTRVSHGPRTIEVRMTRYLNVCVCLCTSVCVCVYIPALSSLAWISHWSSAGLPTGQEGGRGWERGGAAVIC